MWALLLACTPEPPTPRVDAVTPAYGWQGESTDVLVTGDNLLPDIILQGEDGRISTDFVAWLNTTPTTLLEGLELVDPHKLKATVPSTYGFADGTYDLFVQTPSGATATLPDAFAITRTRASRLNLRAVTAAYEAGDVATVTVELLDTQGVVAQEAHGVQIGVVSTAEEPDYSISTEGLADSVVSDLSDQERLVTGSLTDGSAKLSILNDRPDDLTLTVASTDAPDFIFGASMLLSWSQGALGSAEIILPSEDFTAIAGVPFEVTVRLYDIAGNAYVDNARGFLKTSNCGDFFTDDLHITGGEGTVTVALTEVCDVESFRAYVETVEADSPEFPIEPSVHSAYEVTATPTGALAGGTPITLTVVPVDAYGNEVEGTASLLTVRDSVGEFVEGFTACTPAVGDRYECEMRPTLAASGIIYSVTDTEGRTGVSSPEVTISPAEASVAVVTPQVTSTIAGEPFDVVITLYDAYGNVAEFSPGDQDPVMVTDETGTAHCDWDGKLDDEQHFSCTITTATPAATLEVQVGSAAVVGFATETVEVTNARLANISFQVPEEEVRAGDAFTLGFSGSDAFGNAYLVQVDSVVDLAVSAGTLSPTQGTLGADATGTVEATLTAAGAQTIEASQDGLLLGESAEVQVVGGDAVDLAVDVTAWVEAGDSIRATVQALDTWGNTATGYGGSVSVAGSDVCGAVEAPEFVDGLSTVDVPCPTPNVGEALYAADGVMSARSDDFDVLDFDCADGPTAVLLVDGAIDPVSCYLRPTTVELDATGSVAGDAALVHSWLSVDGAEPEQTTTGLESVTFDAVGTYDVTLVVVDEAACAAYTDGRAYFAPNNGEPAGPIEMTPSATSVGSSGAVSVEISAVDCTGDVAVGASVYVRADLGDLGASATGAGLVAVLDGAGRATVPWDFNEYLEAEATLHAGSESGGAYGSTVVSVVGDAVLPEVLVVTPAGRVLGEVSEITILFNEALLESTVSGAVTVEGPSGAIPVTSALSGDDTIVVTPVDPFDGAVGAYTLRVSDTVRDASGNRLDGARTNSASAYTTEIGNVSDETPVIGGCTVSESLFRPDGDPGDDEEADEVEVAWSASFSPVWWWLTVTDALGTRVRTVWVDGEAAVTWDGRDDAGLVVSIGEYSLGLRAVDTHGTAGASCYESVTLDQHVVER